MHDVPAIGEQNEQEAQHYVANVREHVVEVTQQSIRMCTQKVVVAQVLIARLLQDLQTEVTIRFQQWQRRHEPSSNSDG
jgi:hypothetical protein